MWRYALSTSYDEVNFFNPYFTDALAYTGHKPLYVDTRAARAHTWNNPSMQEKAVQVFIASMHWRQEWQGGVAKLTQVRA